MIHLNILVADDSQINITLLTIALKKLGHTVMSALTGQQAIELFKQTRPDLIILDVIMKDMNGFETAKKIREIDSENWIPIIFLSLSVDDESVAKGINAG